MTTEIYWTEELMDKPISEFSKQVVELEAYNGLVEALVLAKRQRDTFEAAVRELVALIRGIARVPDQGEHSNIISIRDACNAALAKLPKELVE